MAQLSLEATFLLASWVEAIVYGALLFMFMATIWVYFSPTAGNYKRDRHTTIMIGISSIMFFLASFHLAMNGYRLVVAYVDHRLIDGGPAAYIGNLPLWDHILKDTLYATQENFGSAAAIYRTWVLWNRDWRVIVLPVILLGVNLAAGYIVCGTYVQIRPPRTVFDPVLNSWIKVFYADAVVLNVITTGLMSYRIWKTHRQSVNYQVGKGRLLHVVRILIESAALQLIIETVLLALYCADINAQYILLESVTAVVAITFNMITVRLKFHVLAEKSVSSSAPSRQVQTIGSMPLRQIHVTINKEVEDDQDPGDYYRSYLPK